MKQITSRDNPVFKRLKALAEDARFRRAEQATLLDGPHLLEAAAQTGAVITRVAVTARAMGRDEIIGLIDNLAPSRCELIELPENLLRAISPVEAPSGIVAEIRVPPSTGNAIDTMDALALEGVQDAGNLGTLLRTAAAAGIRQVLLSPGCAQAWSPKVLRAGMGAHFSLQISEQVELPEALERWRAQIIATSLGVAAENLYALDLRTPTLWLFGSEGAGLSPALSARATHLARIPMAGQTESLNVAAAAAVCLFEQLRQRCA